MQVFMPFPQVRKSLFVLDKIRLGKQRVECRQIIDIIEGRSEYWKNHPAVLMHAKYLNWLKWYYNESLREFENRGGKNVLCKVMTHGPVQDPPWIGFTPFHDSHVSNLLRKGIDDANGVGASGNPKKKSRELLDRLKFFGIMPTVTSSELPYYWPKEVVNE